MLVASADYFIFGHYVYSALVSFGEAISRLGATGAGFYGFFNRLINSYRITPCIKPVFWFDLAGINDIGNFWASEGVKGITGMYQAGFFPIMMFGLTSCSPCNVSYSKNKKEKTSSFSLMAGSICSILYRCYRAT